MVPVAACAAQAHPPDPIVGAYVFVHGPLDPERIDVHRVTRIYYSFALIKDGVMVPGAAVDPANLELVAGLRKLNAKLQVMVSVGGWLGGAEFSDAALTKESRACFARSAVEFLEKYDLDGLDIDWEYPGQLGAGNVFRAEDRENFTLLLAELRARFDEAGPRMHRHLLLTIAAGAGTEFLEHTEMAKVSPLVDQVNLMTYDFCEADGTTPSCHHTALYGNAAYPKQNSVDESVRLMKAAGVPAKKIVIGAAFYGHAWAEVPPENHGLYQPGKPPGNFYASYDNIRSTLLGHGYTRYWDAKVEAPWLYSDEQHTFVSYDDPESLAAKCAYIRSKRLGGIMFWSYFDDSSGELLGAIDRALHAPAH
ncbi:MAG: glycoside hydrolase family 18 protein [Terracidiphilus sp.]|nr:glycoside hydrolase family 18 protein [Terracidiphilus sp.]